MVDFIYIITILDLERWTRKNDSLPVDTAFDITSLQAIYCIYTSLSLTKIERRNVHFLGGYKPWPECEADSCSSSKQ